MEVQPFILYSVYELYELHMIYVLYINKLAVKKTFKEQSSHRRLSNTVSVKSRHAEVYLLLQHH